MSWEMVKLGDIAKLVTGKTPPTENTEYFNGDLLWINPSDFKSKYLNESKRTLTSKAIEDKKCNLLPKGTVLLSCIGDIGKAGILSDRGTSNQQITGLILNENVYPEYLYYFLIQSKSELESLANKAVVAILNNDRLKDFEVLLPPLPIQKRIAEILDAADALKRKDRELLKKYDELAKAIFNDMFGDPVKNEKGWSYRKLKDLCTDIVDCPHSTPEHTDFFTDFPCIRTSEMENGRIIWNKMKYLSEEQYRIRTKRLKPKWGDIVYAREGSFGEAVIIPKEIFFALGQRTMLFRPNLNICNYVFLWYQINSDFVYNQALRKTNGSTVGHINVSDIEKFEIFYPHINLQNHFGKILLKIQDLIDNDLNTKASSDLLFNSLIQKAFKGELVA